MKILLIIALFGASAVAGSIFDGMDSDRKKPRTPDAIAALARLENAQKKAKQEYERAMKAARDQASKELNDVKVGVMKSAGPIALDEANAIQAVLDSLRDGETAAAGGLEGTWRFKFNGGSVHDYIFGPTGKVYFKRDGKGEPQHIGSLVALKGRFLLTESSGRKREIFVSEDRLMMYSYGEKQGESYAVGTKGN